MIEFIVLQYGVPWSTLHDHVSGKVEHGAKPGHDAYLSLEEEEELVSFLVKCAQIGYPHTQKQVMDLFQEIECKVGLHNHFRGLVASSSKYYIADCCSIVIWQSNAIRQGIFELVL